MSKPLVVTIPHRLGREEALRRLKTGLGTTRSKFGHLLRFDEETWDGDRLNFRVTALAQSASGTIDVEDSDIRLEVTLPWLLQRLAEGAQRIIKKEGTLMLEDKRR